MRMVKSRINGRWNNRLQITLYFYVNNVGRVLITQIQVNRTGLATKRRLVYIMISLQLMHYELVLYFIRQSTQENASPIRIPPRHAETGY
jgi:hypothetical protein